MMTLDDKLTAIQQEMAELEKSDNNVYRSIFEAKPIPDSARAKAMEKQQEIAKWKVWSDNELIDFHL